MLNDDDCEKLIMALAKARGESGFTEEEVDILIEWANRTRMHYALLDMTLKGMFFAVNLDENNEPVFIGKAIPDGEVDGIPVVEVVK